jgi:hypothetical protein
MLEHLPLSRLILNKSNRFQTTLEPGLKSFMSTVQNTDKNISNSIPLENISQSINEGPSGGCLINKLEVKNLTRLFLYGGEAMRISEVTTNQSPHPVCQLIIALMGREGRGEFALQRR